MDDYLDEEDEIKGGKIIDEEESDSETNLNDDDDDNKDKDEEEIFGDEY